VAEAKALSKKYHFDIALVDWNLEGETGLDFIKDIQHQSYCPSKLVICSAYSKSFIEHNSQIKSDLLYLAKPLTIFSLGQMLNLDKSDQAIVGSSIVSTATSPESEENTSTKELSKSTQINTILLVEDNKINQVVATKLLESLGLHVDIAENGVSAIELINKNNYPVVLMDIQMPIMDGKEATIELRKTYTSEALNIIALTANITEEEIRYYKEIGMNGHLGKPYELIKIREILSNSYQLNESNT
jgi:CheY-like chemotaxis protein